jgi:hypothetical protein
VISLVHWVGIIQPDLQRFATPTGKVISETTRNRVMRPHSPAITLLGVVSMIVNHDPST